jgi:signal transduction histidine kinase
MSRGIALGVAAAATLGLIAATLVIGINSPIVDRPAVFVTLRTFACLGVLAIALVMAVRGAGGAMPALLIATAAALALTGLTGADAGLPFAIGRIAVAAAVLLVVYVCSAYPTGHVEDPLVRRLILAAAAATAVILAANMLLSNVPPVAGPFVRCSGSACPPNPLNVITLGPGPSNGLSIALALVTAATMVVAAAIVARRGVRATPLLRRSLAPLLTWAGLAAVGYGFFVTVRAVNDHAHLLGAAAVTVVAIIAAMPVALAWGIARGRLFAMAALERMIAALEEESNLAGLQQTMSKAFADPTLQLLFWDPSRNGYVDVDGHVVDVSRVGPERKVARVAHNGENVAAVVHDPVLADDVLEAAGAAARLARDNARLQTNLSASIRELDASRQRVARAADEERRRIEQDLHDGAQQGLIALRIRVQLLEEVATRDPQALAPALAKVGERLQTTLDEIRDLAHGIYPSALRDLGLPYALADVVRGLPVQVVLHAQVHRRFAAETEAAVYFCCVEALQNVAKHCSPSARAELSVFERPDGLHFVLSDDGPGFDRALLTTSHGITGMRDRIEAVGGRLAIRSACGCGTTVAGRVPATHC